MCRSKFHLVLTAIALFVCPVLQPAAAEKEVKLPPREKIHLYVLMGQSNMAGRGRMTDDDRRAVPRVLMLTKENKWAAAKHPLHFHNPEICRVGLGIDFAKVMAEQDPSITIGLVPCAVGGTPLARWSKGGDLYENAVARANVAVQSGTLKGVLWHQGESDTGSAKTANTYAERLDKMINDLRRDLDSPAMPFVAGRLGTFFVEKEEYPLAKIVDAALANLPNRVEHTACAGAENLGHKSDGVHFNADAYHRFGKRYAAEMIRLRGQQAHEGK